MTRLAVIAGMFLCISGPAAAAPIQAACLKSDRGAGKRALCSCVQKVADTTLSTRDQRLAASFFADPHRAQEIRQSSSRRHAEFWERYKIFGARAERYCRL